MGKPTCPVHDDKKCVKKNLNSANPKEPSYYCEITDKLIRNN